MLWFVLVTLLALAAPAGPSESAEQARLTTPPESFTANAQFTGPSGAAATTLKIRVERYTPDAERDAVIGALKQGGYPAFVLALRKAPVVGTITAGGQSFNIRWARAEAIKNGRSIVLVTEKPMFFVGGGAVDAKPREGYEVAVVSFRIDNVGMGYDGKLAAAARVKQSATGGVEIDEYADKLIDLKTITRDLK
jgi:hypothetical protein